MFDESGNGRCSTGNSFVADYRLWEYAAYISSLRKAVSGLLCVSLSVRKLVAGCQLGVSAFVGEMSSAVITLAFNFVILKLAGNVGVAA